MEDIYLFFWEMRRTVRQGDEEGRGKKIKISAGYTIKSRYWWEMYIYTPSFFKSTRSFELYFFSEKKNLQGSYIYKSSFAPPFIHTKMSLLEEEGVKTKKGLKSLLRPMLFTKNPVFEVETAKNAIHITYIFRILLWALLFYAHSYVVDHVAFLAYFWTRQALWIVILVSELVSLGWSMWSTGFVVHSQAREDDLEHTFTFLGTISPKSYARWVYIRLGILLGLNAIQTVAFFIMSIIVASGGGILCTVGDCPPLGADGGKLALATINFCGFAASALAALTTCIVGLLFWMSIKYTHLIKDARQLAEMRTKEVLSASWLYFFDVMTMLMRAVLIVAGVVGLALFALTFFIVIFEYGSEVPNSLNLTVINTTLYPSGYHAQMDIVSNYAIFAMIVDGFYVLALATLVNVFNVNPLLRFSGSHIIGTALGFILLVVTIVTMWVIFILNGYYGNLPCRRDTIVGTGGYFDIKEVCSEWDWQVFFEYLLLANVLVATASFGAAAVLATRKVFDKVSKHRKPY